MQSRCIIFLHLGIYSSVRLTVIAHTISAIQTQFAIECTVRPRSMLSVHICANQYQLAGHPKRCLQGRTKS